MNILDFLNVSINQHFTVLGFTEGAIYYVDENGNIRYHNGVGVTRIGFKNIIDNASKVRVTPKFNDDELATLRQLDKCGYSYIGKDADGDLWAYAEEPERLVDEGRFSKYACSDYKDMWLLPPDIVLCRAGELIKIYQHI